MSIQPGENFGDYVILRKLASGGMAEIYLARKAGEAGFFKPLAVKVILPHLAENKRFVDMFLDEARIAVSLQHANIVQVLDLGQIENNYYIVMEFAHGMDLQRVVQKTRKSGRLLPLPYAAKIVSQIAEGLYYAHTKTDQFGQPLELIHRDISPHNILLTFEGLAKLLDFGVAKTRITVKQEEEGVLKGKFSYMSPEQIRGLPLDARSDIFSLGIVLWEICAGVSLFRESSELLTMEAILHRPVQRPRELRGDMPPDLEAIILKALAKRTVDRFENAYEMHRALESYLNRSGWNVTTQHLSAFMQKLFPQEYQEIHQLLEEERRRLESAGKNSKEAFVPWEPYQKEEEEDDQPLPGYVPQASEQQEEKENIPAARKRKSLLTPVLAGLVAVLVLLLVAFFVYRNSASLSASAPSAPAVASGRLEVSSDPPGARLFINGEESGVTPVVLNELPLERELTIRLEKEGYTAFLQPVILTRANPARTLDIKLARP
jgi:serine/threonine protein kinase